MRSVLALIQAASSSSFCSPNVAFNGILWFPGEGFQLRRTKKYEQTTRRGSGECLLKTGHILLLPWPLSRDVRLPYVLTGILMDVVEMNQQVIVCDTRCDSKLHENGEFGKFIAITKSSSFRV